MDQNHKTIIIFTRINCVLIKYTDATGVNKMTSCDFKLNQLRSSNIFCLYVYYINEYLSKCRHILNPYISMYRYCQAYAYMYVCMCIDKLDFSKSVTCVSAIQTYHKQEISRFQRNKKSFEAAATGSDSWVRRCGKHVSNYFFFLLNKYICTYIRVYDYIIYVYVSTWHIKQVT